MNKVLYHGSPEGNIQKFELRKNTTPGILGKDVKPAIYATDILVYAVAFGFPWSSNNDEVELSFLENGKVELIVPEKIRARLREKVYVYVFDATKFELIPNADPINHNFWTHEEIDILDKIEFESVEIALKALGSEVKYK